MFVNTSVRTETNADVTTDLAMLANSRPHIHYFKLVLKRKTST